MLGQELGLDNDASGLLELPDDAPVGQTLVEYLGLPDASIEIKLTPNRADCFSLRGIAYDVAAATRSEVLDFAADAIPAVGSRELSIQLDAAPKRRVTWAVSSKASMLPPRPRCGWPSACAAVACVRSRCWSTSPSM